MRKKLRKVRITAIDASMPMSFQGLSDQFGSLFLLEDDCSIIGPSAQLCVAHACPDTKIDRYRRLQKEPHIQRTTRPFQKIGERAAHYFFHRSHSRSFEE